MRTRWAIMIQPVAGLPFRAFTWVGSSEAGIRRARLEAGVHGVEVERIWAEQDHG